jgi:metal-responsive CopG/Arc/MetJ family transcriptional regulator
MANSKAISIRVPDELLEKIDTLAEEKYKSHKGTPNRSLVVLDAIVAYFDTLSDTNDPSDIISVSDSVSIVDFNALRDVVIALSDSVKRLEHKFITSSDSVTILNGTELAKRLGVAQSMVSKQKSSQELANWSKAKDPESIAWSYDLETKKFSPIKPLA